jgi:hypothetical protein
MTGRKAIPRAVRRLVRERAGRRCEYCQHPDSLTTAPLETKAIIG